MEQFPRAHRPLVGVFAVVEELAKMGVAFEEMEPVLDAVYELAYVSVKSPIELVPFVAGVYVKYGDTR